LSNQEFILFFGTEEHWLSEHLYTNDWYPNSKLTALLEYFVNKCIRAEMYSVGSASI